MTVLFNNCSNHLQAAVWQIVAHVYITKLQRPGPFQQCQNKISTNRVFQFIPLLTDLCCSMVSIECVFVRCVFSCTGCTNTKFEGVFK